MNIGGTSLSIYLQDVWEGIDKAVTSVWSLVEFHTDPSSSPMHYYYPPTFTVIMRGNKCIHTPVATLVSLIGAAPTTTSIFKLRAWSGWPTILARLVVTQIRPRYGVRAPALPMLLTSFHCSMATTSNRVPSYLGCNSPAFTYAPRPDGRVLTASPEVFAQAEKYAAVPMIIGNQENEVSKLWS